MWLNVCVFGIECLFSTFYRYIFYLVNKIASAVESMTNETFGSFILHNRTQRCKDGWAALVFRCYELNSV